MINRALFLDRDGIINIDYGYVHLKENFDFIDGIFELVKAASTLGMKIIVVTNQAGIGRGIYNEKQFHELSEWMCSHFEDQGTPIDRVYFCPSHPIHGLGVYKKDDYLRKPSPGMLLKAKNEFSLDLNASVFIGDKPSDIIAGNAANIGLNMLLSKNKTNELTPYSYTLIHSLYEAIPLLQTA